MALADYQGLADKYATKYGLDKSIVRSVIQTESSWNPFAVGTSGEKGLMQIMPATAKMLGLDNGFDPEANIEAGTRYLSEHYGKYGNYRDALARYNAGTKLQNGYGYADKVLKGAGISEPATPGAAGGATKGNASTNETELLESPSLGFAGSKMRTMALWAFALLLIVFGTWRLINV